MNCQLIHLTLEPDGIDDGDIRHIGSGNIFVPVIGETKDIRISIAKISSGPHHTHLVVRSFVPAGYCHRQLIFPAVSGKFNRYFCADLRFGSKIPQRQVRSDDLVRGRRRPAVSRAAKG